MADPLDFAVWDEPPDSDPQGSTQPVDRPTEWNGKPIPENAEWEDDGVTPKLTPTGRIKRTRGGKSPTRTSSKAKTADLHAIRTDLVELFAFGAVSSAPLLPTVSLVLVERGEMTADAIVALAKDRPAMLAAIQRVSKVGPVVVIVQTGAMVGVAALVDLQRAPWDNPLAMMTGVSEKYAKTHPGAQPTNIPQAPPAPHMAGGGVSGIPPFIVKDRPQTWADKEHAGYAFAGRAGPGDNGGNADAPSSTAFYPHAGGTFGSPFPGAPGEVTPTG